MTRVAIVHDWLVTSAGAERVLQQMLTLFPDADLYSLIDFMPEDLRTLLGGRRARTSFLQRLPGARKHYRSYLPLMPLAVEQFDLSAYDLVLSSSYAVAKGVITGPDQLHLCMCYSPIRYAWDLQHQYLQEAHLTRGIRGALARYILHRIRTWDVRTANGVDGFIAISHYIARRIWKVYRRESTVIYPPVDVDEFTLREQKEDFYLTASRLVPYKRIDLIVAAFAAMPDRKLVVIGDGPEARKIRALAGLNTTILGHQPFPVLRDHMQRARAFVFAAEEDFGIAPLEAQACGTPVIAYDKGGARETIAGLDQAAPTGVRFAEQSADAIRHAVTRFEQLSTPISPCNCRRNAMRFSADRFRTELADYVSMAMEQFRARSGKQQACDAAP
ncbi:MAG TPA: glycosyltransferase family 4 protein [Gemmatimonadaceae bacterium]|nr:glycosyltransferase family 4 protein [Gemmatimonadaceae bacterium]